MEQDKAREGLCSPREAGSRAVLQLGVRQLLPFPADPVHSLPCLSAPDTVLQGFGAQGGGGLREGVQEQGAAWGEGAAVGTAHRAAKSKGLSSAGGELKLLLVSVQVLQSHLSSCSLSLSQLVILVSFSSKGYYSM